MDFNSLIESRNIQKMYNTLLQRMNTKGVTHYAPGTLIRYNNREKTSLKSWDEYTSTMSALQSKEDKRKLTESYFFDDNCYNWLNSLIFSEIDKIKLTPDNYCIDKIDMYSVYEEAKEFLNPEIIEEMKRRLYEFKICLDRLQGIHLCFFDTETTGLDDNRQPTQIAGIITDIDLNPVCKFNTYIQQDHIDEGASSITGITPEYLRSVDAESEQNAMKLIDEIINTYNPIFIGHNIRFDFKTIENLYSAVGSVLKADRFPMIDTLSNAERITGFKTVNKKLQTLKDALNISDESVVEIINNTDSIKVDYLSNKAQENSRLHDALFDSATVLMLTRVGKMFGDR